MNEITIRLSLRNLAIIAAFAGLIALALHIPSLLVEGFLALVLASALLPGVRHLERRHWPRPAAVMVLFATAVGTLVVIGGLVAPRFMEEASTLSAALPRIVESWGGWYEWLRGLGRPWSWLPAPVHLLPRVGADAAHVLGQSLDWARRTAEAIGALAIVLVLAFFVLLDGPQLRRGLLALVPARYRSLVDAQLDPIAFNLGRYVQGTLLSMAFFIVFQAVALSLVGLPLALGVAVVAGVLEVIPMLGTLVGLALGLGLAATVSWHMVVVVALLFIVGRGLQDNLINPWVYSHSLKLPPTLVIVALLLGASLMGLAGALIAVPLLATIQVLVQNLYVAPMQARERAEPVGSPEPIRLRVSFWSAPAERPIKRD